MVFDEGSDFLREVKKLSPKFVCSLAIFEIVIELWSIYQKKKNHGKARVLLAPFPCWGRHSRVSLTGHLLTFTSWLPSCAWLWVLWWQLIALQGMFVTVVWGLGGGQQEPLCVGSGLWCWLSFSLHVKETEPDPSPPRQALYFDRPSTAKNTYINKIS